MQMKKLTAKILFTGVLCSCALSAQAFEYISPQAGFSVDIPDQNIIAVGENTFGVENRVFDAEKNVIVTSGIHMVTCLTAENVKNNFDTDFSTDKFNADLKAIQESLKKSKNPLQNEAYNYLAQAAGGAYVNITDNGNISSGALKINKQLTSLASINKIKVDNINGNAALLVEADINNIGFEMKLPLKKADVISEKNYNKQDLEKQGVHFAFSEDGYLITKFENLYNIRE